MAATFAALTGAQIPAGNCLDSFNVLPALLGQQTVAPLRPHFVAHNGGTEGPFSIQVGDWKYLQTTPPVRDADTRKTSKANKAGKSKGMAKPGLFNLAQDIGEENNLADKETAKVTELKELLAKLRAIETAK
jgi:hypothetical protein